MSCEKELEEFRRLVWSFYKTNGRTFPWRCIDNPYHVLVSEIMLQQTQTYRVIEKYNLFIDAFSSIESLSCADLHDVLLVWQGLGYNRRGKYLHQLSKVIVTEYGGKVPDRLQQLELLPGIGKATAASICAFAFNKPTVFVETNIRAVFIHHFFIGKADVLDADIMLLVKKTVDLHNPREWYYALMDYGVFIKKNYPNPNRKSAHYTKQSAFNGSDRQIRGMIIKLLTQSQQATKLEICNYIRQDFNRINKILDKLLQEKMIVNDDNLFSIS